MKHTTAVATVSTFLLLIALLGVSCTRYTFDEEPEQSVGALIGFNNAIRTDTMFLPSEPREVFYNNDLRWFNPNKPLQITLTSQRTIDLKLYSPIAVSDVDVYATVVHFPGVEFYLAHFDRLYPFMAAEFRFPLVHEPVVVMTTDRKIVELPAMPQLSPGDIEFRIDCSDPFLQKTAAITSNWMVCFSPFQADQGHAYWRHMTPELCRHGVALALNMAYMFSTPEFDRRLDSYNGQLTDNNGNPINLDELRERLRTHPGLTLGRVEGVGGLGGGRTYGLADYCYKQVYWDWEADPLANPHTYVRQAMFHEYGHCLGYSHESTMTYGDKWTVLCAECFVALGAEGRLPVCSKNDVN